MPTLESLLSERTKEAVLYEKLPDRAVRCFACGHRCLVREGRPGICRVRFNREGTLYAPTGYVGALQCDPIEKKPFFHAYPGALAFSFGMLGCDLHCGYCQNWLTSQALRDPASIAPPEDADPKGLARLAVEQGAAVMVSTYNEPLITSEWAVEVFREAKAAGIVCGYVSNGNATEQVLDYIRPWADLYKVDLKGFTEKGYRELGGTLRNVLDSIALIHRKGFWMEIVTLVVPGFNDGEDELRSMARFIHGVSPDIPWHVTAFHSDYKMQDKDDTPTRAIVRGARIGVEEGLRFVYAGNRPGQVGDLENTYCPDCKELLIERFGFYVRANRLVDRACPKCARPIPGRWSLPNGRSWKTGDGRIRAIR